MRISDWSSDVCSSDLIDGLLFVAEATADLDRKPGGQFIFGLTEYGDGAGADVGIALFGQGAVQVAKVEQRIEVLDMIVEIIKSENPVQRSRRRRFELKLRSEEHTSELQSLMRTSYAVFRLKINTIVNLHEQH